jgi:hypothetical protein
MTMAVFWVLAASETSVNVCHITRRNNPEDSRLHIRRYENLKSRKLEYIFKGMSLLQTLG